MLKLPTTEVVKKILSFAAHGKFIGRRTPMTCKVSLVVPTYNVDRYFDEFMRSVVVQSTGLHNVEIIVVDDGSTDSSGEIAQAWQRNYPDNIRYIRQENQGVSEARNTGLAIATGEWISFPDPDDVLDRDYLHQINKVLSRKRAHQLALLGCNIIEYYDNAEPKIRDTHPLRYKFTRAYSEKRTTDLQSYIQMQAASTWFNLPFLKSLSLKFDPKVVPTF